MVDIKFPDLLSHVFKVFEENSSFSRAINSRQGTKRSIGIHTDPFFFCLLFLLQQPVTMPFQFPSIKACSSGKQSGHERRQERPPENSSQQHDLDVIVYRTAVI